MIHDNMTVYMTDQKNEQRKERYWLCYILHLHMTKKGCLTVYSSRCNTRQVGGFDLRVSATKVLDR